MLNTSHHINWIYLIELISEKRWEVELVGGGLSELVGGVRLAPKTGGTEVETPATSSLVFFVLHHAAPFH